MTTAEAMAVAVLKGDLVAARALADHLCETEPDRERQLLPIKTFKVDATNVRGIAFTMPELGNDVLIDVEGFRQTFDQWLRGEIRFMPTVGISRIELYEFPERKIGAMTGGAERLRQEQEAADRNIHNRSPLTGTIHGDRGPS